MFIRLADRDGNITYLNKTARAWKGLAPDAPLQGLRVHPGSAARLRQAEAEGIWQGEADNFPVLTFSRDSDGASGAEGAAGGQGGPVAGGRPVWKIVTAHTDGAGETVLYSTLAVARGQQTPSERARLHLHSIIEDTPEFVAAADGAGRIVYLNRAARRMLGVDSEEEAPALEVRDVHPPWAFARLMEEGFPTAAREGQWEGETAVVTRDGREIRCCKPSWPTKARPARWPIIRRLFGTSARARLGSGSCITRRATMG